MKPCPFCASKNIAIRRDLEAEEVSIVCYDCGARTAPVVYSTKESMPGYDRFNAEQMAKRLWDRRESDFALVPLQPFTT